LCASFNRNPFQSFISLRMDIRRNLAKLKHDLKKGKRFTLFVGAGVNASNNVRLLWNDIFREACNYAFRRIGNNLGLKSKDTHFILSLLGMEKVDYKYFSTSHDPEHCLSVVDFERYTSLKNYITTHFPVEIQVSIIKALLGDAYIPFIQDYLYNQCNQKKIKDSFESYKIGKTNKSETEELYTLYVTARMILLNPQFEAVITYNYDNFLSFSIDYLLKHAEEFFSPQEIIGLKRRYSLKENESLSSVCAAYDVYPNSIRSDFVNNKSIAIHHVHGYIPSPNELQRIDSNGIILSMDEFCSSINDVHSWFITTQENAILTTNCLFIGNSLTDLSTKRLLNLAYEKSVYNIYMLDAYTANKENLNPLQRAQQSFHLLRDSYLSSLKVNVIDSDKGFRSLYQEIHSINSLT